MYMARLYWGNWELLCRMRVVLGTGGFLRDKLLHLFLLKSMISFGKVTGHRKLQ